MRYFQKLLCLLILVLAASFGVGGCVLLYSDFSVQRSRMAAANAAAHAQACTLLQTEILDLQRRGISTGDAALTARVTAQNVPAALWRGDTLVCATLEGLQSLPLGDAATVTVRTENSIYAVYASDLQGGLRLVTAYDLTGLYRDRNAALMRFLLLEAAVLAKGPMRDIMDFMTQPNTDTAAAAAKVLNSGAMKPLEAGGLKAFITTFRSGHTAIVQRRGAERLPVKKLLSPAVPHMMGNEEVRAEAEALAYETLQREIGKRIEQLTGAKA